MGTFVIHAACPMLGFETSGDVAMDSFSVVSFALMRSDRGVIRREANPVPPMNTLPFCHIDGVLLWKTFLPKAANGNSNRENARPDHEVRPHSAGSNMQHNWYKAAIFSAILSPGVLSPQSADAAGFEILAPHRAIYDVRLREASDRSGIEAMSGRIVYEITGNACDGLTMRYRFVTSITTAESNYQTDQQTSTFESPDGKEFTFLTKTFVDQRPESVVRGNALRTPQGLTVSLAEPAERKLVLPEAYFISTHLVTVIESAMAGEKFVRAPIFDGSQDADEIVTSSTVIGEARKFPEIFKDESKDAVAPLSELEAWPVTISYFEGDPGNTGEALPSYEASFLLYGNGVSRRLVMRYPDYTMQGELTQLEMLEPTPCTPEK